MATTDLSPTALQLLEDINPTEAREVRWTQEKRRSAPPIHEVLLDEEAPASELVRAHLATLSDAELEDAALQIELQQLELASEPAKSQWVRAGWEIEHCQTMLACSARATYRKISRRAAIPKSGAVGRDNL